MTSIRLLRSVAEIEALTSAWETLLRSSNCHPAFSSPTWFLGYLQSYPVLKSWVWVAEDGGRVTGIAPLAIHEETGQVCLLDDIADYQDFIVARGDFQTVRILLHAILGRKDDFSGLLLGGLRVTSSILNTLDTMGAAVDKLICRDKIHSCYFTDLSMGYEGYIQNCSPGFRFNLRKAYRRAKERGIEVVELTPQDMPGSDVVDHFLRLHLLRFPDKLFSRPESQRFCKIALPALFEQQKLRVFALRTTADIVGIHLSVCDVNGLGIWNGGFDPEVSSVSPGKILINSQIQACCAAGLATFDFLRGEEPYKISWSTGCQAISEVSMR